MKFLVKKTKWTKKFSQEIDWESGELLLLLKTSNLIFLILQDAQRWTVLSNINIFISLFLYILYLYKISSGPSNTGTFNIKNIDINKQSIMYIYRNTGTPYKC